MQAFGRLGAADVQVMGNLKYDLEPLPDDAVEKARTGLGDGPWIVATGTVTPKKRRCWRPAGPAGSAFVGAASPAAL